MIRVVLPVCLVLIAAPALAQQLPVAPLGSPGEQMRRFLLANQSGQTIVSAEAWMTDGEKRVLTYAPIPRNQARWIVIPRQECLDSMVVKLDNGLTQRAKHMNNCKAIKIVVGQARIVITPNQDPLSR
ncbi:MAG TPA: hypothetical protein VMB73_13510 [Acetobacteraceae bacterium]|jgi:hypothetical protein|nr:hypothetical protein [Acetobacteraceae bacterium]